MKGFSTVALVVALGVGLAGAQPVTVDPAIAPYTKKRNVSGNLNAVGSDTMNNLMTLWAEAFRKHHPAVRIQVEGKGSSTAPAALIAGTAQLGPMSREMKDSEVDAIVAKYGFEPTAIVTALDVLAVYVHKDNPLQSLSLPELDAIFSKTRRLGFPRDLTTWGQLGLGGEWATKPISLYGRNAASGTYGYFKDHALGGGDFKDTVKEQPGSASVVQGISEDRYGIGYSGIGYVTTGVKALALAKKAGDKAYAPNYEDALSKAYPLSRPLYIYVVQDPRKPVDPLVEEFLHFVLSQQGQEIVIKDGYLPLTGAMVQAERAKLAR
ncbi:MAG: phosphate ABC transporter substrate-binding protein [Thermoanaerobaculum sp.]|nr:phosphate ABC transporter substrate-binding protein [Thermoanaerobaculum sp.]